MEGAVLSFATMSEAMPTPGARRSATPEATRSAAPEAQRSATVVRDAEGRWEPFEDFGEATPVPVRRLREHSPEDPGSGDPLLMRFPPGFRASLPPGTSPWQELFVLAGRLQVDEAWYGVGDYVNFPPGYTLSALAAGDDGAEALVVRGPREAGPITPIGAKPGRPDRRAVPRGEWGYVDLKDRTDRLPLRWERTRGEATWLLRYPPGHTGTPTRADGVALEALVLSGYLSVEGFESPFGPRDYLFFPAGAIPDTWRTQHGCEMLLRTIAAPGELT
jgi:hypothetical protein